MLHRKCLVALTEHEQASWISIKVEKWDNKKYNRHTESVSFFNETCYFKSNFDFEKPMAGSIKTR